MKQTNKSSVRPTAEAAAAEKYATISHISAAAVLLAWVCVTCLCVLCNINKNCLLQLLAICFREQKPFRHIFYISPRRQLHFHFHRQKLFGTLLRSNVDFRCRYSLTEQTPPLGGSAQTADAGHAPSPSPSLSRSLDLFAPLKVNNKRRLQLLSALSCFNMRNSSLSCLPALPRPVPSSNRFRSSSSFRNSSLKATCCGLAPPINI